ncbi:hypothetical protein Efla_001133 [Eimeria flavescens]
MQAARQLTDGVATPRLCPLEFTRQDIEQGVQEERHERWGDSIGHRVSLNSNSLESAEGEEDAFAGTAFSISQMEVLIQVQEGTEAWQQINLINTSPAAVVFALQQQQHTRELPPADISSHSLIRQPATALKARFYAWPLRGVALPGETMTLLFGFCRSQSRGVHCCEWELRIYPGDQAESSARLDTADTGARKTISVFAVVSSLRLPVERMWHQRKENHRKHAFAATHETLEQLLGGVFLHASEINNINAGKYLMDPLVKEKLFFEANASRGLQAPQPLVDSFLSLRQQVDVVQGSQQYQQLELLQRTFPFLHGGPQKGRSSKRKECEIQLLYACDDCPQQQLAGHVQRHLQKQFDAAVTCVYHALSSAIETFVSALPEASDPSGDEKGRPGARGSKRQNNRGRRDSKGFGEPNGEATPSEASIAAAAAAAAAAASALSSRTANHVAFREGKLVAEQVLHRLLLEAVDATEMQLALHAAERAVAAGGAVAEAARLQQGQRQRQSLQQQLRQIPLPSKLDFRVHLMAEYLAKNQVNSVKACGMAVVLMDGKISEELIYLLQQPNVAQEQQVSMRRMMQQRLGYLPDLLAKARDGVLLCLEISSQQLQRMQLQEPACVRRLLEELVNNYLLPALSREDEQHQLLMPVACLYSSVEAACLVKEAFAKTGVCIPDNDAGFAAAKASSDSEDFDVPPCLFIVPSWQSFFNVAAGTLNLLQYEQLASAAVRVQLNGSESPDLLKPAKLGYLTAQRHLKDLMELLKIDLVILDSLTSTKALAARNAVSIIERGANLRPSAAAGAAASAEASSPWLVNLPVTRALGPLVMSYLLVACSAMGIDADALQERAAQVATEWSEELSKKHSLDAAAATATRQTQRKLKQLATGVRSCCYCTARADEISDAATAGFERDGPPMVHDRQSALAFAEGLQPTAVAVLCMYWDSALVHSPPDAGPASLEPFLQWSGLCLQQLRAVVSGTVVSNVFLAGDLVSLVCGFALNGDIVLERQHQNRDPPCSDKVDAFGTPAAKANAFAQGAAFAATGDATLADAEWSLSRGWLRVPELLQNEIGCSGSCTTQRSSCKFTPWVCGVTQLRKFVRQELLTILNLADERNVDITLPSEIVLQVYPGYPPEAAAGSTPAADPSCARRTSAAGLGTQRSGNRHRRSVTKHEASDGIVEDAVASEPQAMVSEKEKPMLVICHLPQSKLIWNVLRNSKARAASAEDNMMQTRARSFLHENHEHSETSGVYASLTLDAIRKTLELLRARQLVLWLGGKLTRQQEDIEASLEAAGIPDATSAMMQGFLNATEKYAKSPIRILSSVFGHSVYAQGACQLSAPERTTSGLMSSLVPLQQVLVELEKSSKEHSSDSSAPDIRADSECGKTFAKLRRVKLEGGSQGVDFYLFGSVASNIWQCAGARERIHVFLEEGPLFQMLQGKRIRDLCIADDAMLGAAQSKAFMG